MKDIKPEKVFVILALIFGVLFVFLTPPFQSPDEDSHFKKAYLTSRGVLYPTVKKHQRGNALPNEMLRYISKKTKYMGKRNKKYKYSEFVTDQYATLNYNKKSFATYSTSSSLCIAYIPSALGILTSKVFAKVMSMDSVSVPYMIYFARLFTLFFSVFIIYHAIKITPVLKKTMTTVALMPMTIFMISMISYDGIIITTSLLTTAFLLKLKYDKNIKKINWKHLLMLIILGFILFNYKTIYCSVFIFAFFIPKEKFGSFKKMLLDFLIVGASILALSMIIKLPMTLLPKTYNPSREIIARQTKYVMSHPLDYTGILFENIRDQRLFQLTSMVGMFGLLDTYLPLAVVAFYLFLLVFMAITEGIDDKNKITIPMKIASVFAVTLTVCLVFTALYLRWTPVIFNKVGGRVITGVQGRYFIPLLFPILLIFSNKKIKSKYIDIAKNYYAISIVITLIISTFTILLRFWV